MKVEELKVVIEAQTKQFETKLNEVKKGLEGVGANSKQVGGVLSGPQGFIAKIGLAAGAVVILQRALRALVGAFKSVVRSVRDSINSFERVRGSLVKLTGATGEGLGRLVDVAYDVSKTVPQSIDEVTQVVGDLNTRLGITGDTLKVVSKQLLDFARVSGTEVSEATRGITRLMADWGVPLDDIGLMLDQLTLAGQKSGIGIGFLTDRMVTFGVQLRTLGYTQTEAIALMAKWEAEGVSAEKIFAGLSMGVGRLAQETDDIAGTFRSLVGELIAFETEGEAVRRAIEVLGTRAGPDFALAAREGRFEMGAWTDELVESLGVLERSAEASLTARDRLAQLGNIIQAELRPIFQVFSESVGGFVKAISRFVQDNAEVIRQYVVRVASFFYFLARVIQAILARLPFIGKYFTGFTKGVTEAAKSGEIAGDRIEAGLDRAGRGAENAQEGVEGLKKELQGLAGFDELNVLRSPTDTGTLPGMPDIAMPDLGGLGEGIEEVTEQLKEFENMMEEIKRRAKGLWETFTDAIRPVWEALEPLRKILGKILSKIAEWVKENPVLAFTIGLVVAGLLALAAILVPTVILSGLFATNLKAIAGLGIVKKLAPLAPLLGKIAFVAGVAGLMFYSMYTYIKEFGDYWEARVIIWKHDFEVVRDWIQKVGRAVWSNWTYDFGRTVDWVKDRIAIMRDWIRDRLIYIASLFAVLRNRVLGRWTEIVNGIRRRIITVRDWIRGRLQVISGYFTTLRNNVVRIFDNIRTGITQSFSRLVTRIRTLINNSIVDPLNSARLVINRGVPGVHIGYIPRLARGGIIDSPTIAMVGEAGREAVVPLENTAWMDELADKIGGGGGGHLTVQIGDDTIYDKAIDYIQKKGMRTGSNILRL